MLGSGRQGVEVSLSSGDGLQRMSESNGWVLLQDEKTHTVVTYVMHTELGGDIPPWLANTYIHLLPFQTLNNLIKVVEGDVNSI